MGILNEELPDNISFSKVAPSNINEFFKRDYLDFITEYYKPIVAGFDFEKKLTLILLTTANSLTLKETVYSSSPSSLPEPYDNLAETVVGGDSGNPLFIIIGGEAILLTSYQTATDGPSYANYISDINDLIGHADSNAGIFTLLKATEFDINSLGFFKF